MADVLCICLSLTGKVVSQLGIYPSISSPIVGLHWHLRQYESFLNVLNYRQAKCGLLSNSSSKAVFNSIKIIYVSSICHVASRCLISDLKFAMNLSLALRCKLGFLLCALVKLARRSAYRCWQNQSRRFSHRQHYRGFATIATVT